jgi:2-polyprenyl-6-methoxyphenol hydroxylase-like FAD-dependent oxidoreductase
MVIYPIVNDVDGEGNQLINWMAEIEGSNFQRNDWNEPGKIEDFYKIYESWSFDWLDVAAMIRDADQILEYPMVDKDPVKAWTFGRVTLAGDAAHPMYPRGSNGSAQAAIDTRTLAGLLTEMKDPVAALKAYEATRLEAAYKVVLTNRSTPPDFINIKVEELVGDQPFDDLDKYITQAELRALSENYKKVAGFSSSDASVAGR